MSPGASLGWLHLTDLHQGLHSQNWLWPGVREKLHEDLERLHARSGPWDFVLFTGDLTQRGSEAEFQALDETLEELWRLFRGLGSSPVLLAVPGNHDLVRPEESEVLQELQAWDGWPSVQERFWQTSTGRLRRMIDEAFHPFSDWQSRWYARHPLPPFVTFRHGILPGDFSAGFVTQDIRLGFVGLNSAFLQLMNGDFRGRLDLDVRQLHGVCDGDAMAWIRGNHATFLLTHHPVDWLHPRSQSHFRAEIDEPGRFAAHFFGHMHSAGAAAERLFGFEQQCRIQGASLFGLESFGEQEKRIHGYSAGRLELSGPRLATLRFWPRLLVQSSAGFRHIIPDPNFRLEQEAFTQSVPVRSVSTNERLTAADAAAIHARHLTERLNEARVKSKALMKAGGHADALARAQQEILQLQRELREGRPLQPGDLLSARYELLERIGAGGFATVWKAFDDKEDRLVALKVLHRDVAEDTSRRERFFKGTEAMRRLRHPNILQVLELRGEDGPYLYAVLEYAPGGDLRSAVKNGLVSREQFFEAILSVGDALEEAHRHGLIHRDVKPANILLKDGRALLGDFDLVRVTDSAVITRTGVMGTFLYAAPEVLESGRKADARSDVFSLGMTVLHGLYGDDLPLESFRASSSFIERLDCEEPLQRVLLQAVQWERRERYASIAAFCTALEQALNDTITETGAHPPRQEETQRPRHPGELAPTPLSDAADPEETQPTRRMKRHERGPVPVWALLLTTTVTTAMGTALLLHPWGEEPRKVEPTTPTAPQQQDASAVAPNTAEPAPAQTQGPHGTVRFKVSPWAEVSCGGRALGSTPLPDVWLRPGVYECKFSNPDWGSRTRQVEVKSNTQTDVVVNLP